MLECVVTVALVGKGTKFRDICQLLTGGPDFSLAQVFGVHCINNCVVLG